MADDLRMALTYLLRKAEMAARWILGGRPDTGQALMILRFPSIFGRRRTSGPPNAREGGRPRQWDTCGNRSNCSPGSRRVVLPEPAGAPAACGTAWWVVQEAYVQASPRVDDLVKALGMTVISKSQVSQPVRARFEVERFRNRRLTEEYSVRLAGRHVPQSSPEGRHRLHGRGDRHRGNRHRRAGGIGVDVGPPRTAGSAAARNLVSRGLKGVQLVTSDSHQGLKNAIAATVGSCWRGAGCTSCATRWPMCRSP